MNFQSGRMGSAEGIGLAYGITFPLVFLSTPAYLAEVAGPLSWVTPLTGGMAAGILFGGQLFLVNRYSADLLTISERLMGKAIAFTINIFYLGVMFGTACLWTRQFAENTLLTALPAAEFNNVILWLIWSLPCSNRRRMPQVEFSEMDRLSS